MSVACQIKRVSSTHAWAAASPCTTAAWPSDSTVLNQPVSPGGTHACLLVAFSFCEDTQLECVAQYGNMGCAHYEGQWCISNDITPTLFDQTRTDYTQVGADAFAGAASELMSTLLN